MQLKTILMLVLSILTPLCDTIEKETHSIRLTVVDILVVSNDNRIDLTSLYNKPIQQRHSGYG